MNINKSSKIYVAGHRGMVGSAIVRLLRIQGYDNLVSKTRKELDLRNQSEVNHFIRSEKPDLIIDAAARVGGILANNDFPYQFLMDNLQMQNNLIAAAHENDVNNFIFLGSSCIYPKLAPQPLKEEYLLTGSLESTNQWYAIAKITGVKLCQAIRTQFGKDYTALMPTNLYGPYDNFDLKTSHVLPAMIRKFHEAVQNGHSPVTLWGSGSPMREFLYVDDVARAVLFVIENNVPEFLLNVGTGTDITIKDLAYIIQKVSSHKGEIQWDSTKPDGTPRKLMDISVLHHYGWKHEVDLEEGIQSAYSWFKDNIANIKEVKL